MENTTILIADDNENDITLMRKILERLDLADSLQVVPDGAEAIDYLSGQGNYSDRERFPYPSLLILDMAMPKKTGQEVIDWLKGTSDLQRLFVVMMTGACRRLSSDMLFERHGNIVFLNSELLKPATLPNVENLIGLFRSWLQAAERREVSSAPSLRPES